MENKMDLGQKLNYAQRYGLHTIPSDECDCPAMSYDKNVVAIGNFRMQSHSHSTGNSVRVYIVGAGEPYLILRGTYWKVPGYDWNPFHREYGAWDKLFVEATRTLTNSIKDHKEKTLYAKQLDEQREVEKEENRKREVEQIFK